LDGSLVGTHVGLKDGRAVEIDVGALEGLVGLLVKRIVEHATLGTKDGLNNEVALGPDGFIVGCEKTISGVSPMASLNGGGTGMI